jgi:hypothetical protein
MDLVKLQDFFLWGLIINIIIYIIQMLLSLALRKFLSKSHGKLFGLNEETIKKSLYLYFAIYKIIINAFFLAPWIAIEIIK